MQEIFRSETDPYFNIAAEEYLIRHSVNEICMVWVNKPAVVCGKHQNVFAEVNHKFTWSNNIPVIRRISGGGTVYHDEGNLNYTLILNGKQQNLVDYEEYTKPVLLALKKIGIKAKLHGKSDLVIGDRKFSGNSMHVFKNRVIHHGTLLFSSNIDNLRQALLTDESAYQSKAVRSNRSHVTNISEHLKQNMTFSEFREFFTKFLKDFFNASTGKELTDTEKAIIKKLTTEKYNKWEWNYAYSPAFRKKISGFPQKINTVLTFGVSKGVIESIETESMEHVPDWLNELVYILKNKRFHPDDIREALISCNFANTIDPDRLIEKLF
ncbi:MAG: lipoate--protein ligase family protein [Bacteroidetes bacterium]|nr:lipoate--protein ligase family protein [Bacteroidota bacterium]